MTVSTKPLISDVMIRTLVTFVEKGKPMTAYELSKSARIPHTTLLEHLPQMLSMGLLRVVEERVLKSGIKVKFLDITERGVTLYFTQGLPNLSKENLKDSALFDQEKPIPLLYPRSWSKLETIIENRSDFLPWLHKQLQICRRIGTHELFRAFAFIYFNVVAHYFVKAYLEGKDAFIYFNTLETFVYTHDETKIWEDFKTLKTPAVDLERQVLIFLASCFQPRMWTFDEQYAFFSLITSIQNHYHLSYISPYFVPLSYGKIIEEKWQILADQAKHYLLEEQETRAKVLETLHQWYANLDRMKLAIDQIEKSIKELDTIK